MRPREDVKLASAWGCVPARSLIDGHIEQGMQGCHINDVKEAPGAFLPTSEHTLGRESCLETSHCGVSLTATMPSLNIIEGGSHASKLVRHARVRDSPCWNGYVHWRYEDGLWSIPQTEGRTKRTYGQNACNVGAPGGGGGGGCAPIIGSNEGRLNLVNQANEKAGYTGGTIWCRGLWKIARQWRGLYLGFHKHHIPFLVADECCIPLELLISPWKDEFKEAYLSPQCLWNMSFCSICHKLVTTQPTNLTLKQGVVAPCERGWLEDVRTILWEEVD